MTETFKPTKHEIEVLEMLAGIRPLVRGAWVNACAEFLIDAGFLTLNAHLTDKGRAFLAERAGQKAND